MKAKDPQCSFIGGHLKRGSVHEFSWKFLLLWHQWDAGCSAIRGEPVRTAGLVVFRVYFIGEEECAGSEPAGAPGDVAASWVFRHLGLEPDAKQAVVLSSSSRRGILNCSRQWGKSTMAAAKAVHQAVCGAGSLTVVVSPSARQSGEFVRKARGFARMLKLRARGDGDNEISLAFPNGSRIVGLPGSEATIRGFSAVSLLLVDEAARVDDELYLAIRPMLAASDGALWLMSTPFGARGFFYDTWQNGGPEWERVRVPATECARISKTFLQEEQKVMGERYFRQEYLCEFGDAEGSVFSSELIDQAVSHEFEPFVFS